MSYIGRKIGLGYLYKNGAGAQMANVKVNDFINALQFRVVAGAAANTGITVSGLDVSDRIAFVMEIDYASPTTTPVDRTSITSISAQNQIKLTSSTSGNALMVVFWDLT